MKKLLYLILFFLASGCKDEPADIRQAAVGKYIGNATFYILDGTTLAQTALVSADPMTISTVSTTDKILIDFGDGDLATGIDIKPSSNGFTFSIKPFSSYGLNFTGYAGYESDGGHYHGGFNKTGNVLELWYQYTFNGTIKVTKCSMTKQ